MTRLSALAVWSLLLAACDAAAPVAADLPAPAPAPTAAKAEPLRQSAPSAGASVEAGYPALTGRVVDRADLIAPEDESRLAAASAELEQRTTDQLVIVTVPSLGGRSIEDYALELGNRWRVGREDRDNGVLLVVAPNERRTRIAVGYGLEPILTNARAAEIIDRDMLPAFRESRWTQGISAGADSVIRILVEHADEPRKGRP